MNFEYTKKSLELQKKLNDFMGKHIFPNEKEILDFRINNPWKHSPKLRSFKKFSKKRRSMEFISSKRIWKIKSRSNEFRICSFS